MRSTHSDSHYRRRQKVDLACDVCRQRKVKCDGGRPVCGNCSKRPTLRAKCAYATPLPRLATSPPHQHGSGIVDPSVASSVRASHLGNSSSSAFTGQIKAAIDARSGAAPHPQTPAVTPMVDVPLFPLPQNDAAAAAADGVADGLDYDLPPRKRADGLVQAYWSFFHPMFPIMHRPQFMRSYEALFAGTTTDTDANERIFSSTLNVIFAMSIQLQESLESSERERLSGKYFQRAHNLLPSPLWETGSIDLVQCLLLMSQYLQCTNQSFQTWMVIGSAIRIAQGLELHQARDVSSRDESLVLARRVWQSCITMDRYVDL